MYLHELTYHTRAFRRSASHRLVAWSHSPRSFIEFTVEVSISCILSSRIEAIYTSLRRPARGWRRTTEKGLAGSILGDAEPHFRPLQLQKHT